jgi:hypothetical protein
MSAADDRSSRARPVLPCYDGSRDAAEAIRLAADLTGRGPAVVLYAWLPPSAQMPARRIVADDHPVAAMIAEFDQRVLGSTSHGVVSHYQRPVLVAPCIGDHEAVTA